MKTPANLAEMAHEETGQWLDSDLLETWVVRRFNRLEQKIRNLESEHEAKVIQNAQLMRERDAYRTAEEHQIALRQKLEEREAALAAHVERLQEAGDKLREPWDLSTVLGAETRRRIEGWDKARAESPVTSLARRDSHPDCELECGAYGTYCKCAAEKSQQAAWDKEEEDLKKVRDGKMSTNTFRRIHFPELAASSKTEDHQ